MSGNLRIALSCLIAWSAACGASPKKQSEAPEALIEHASGRSMPPASPAVKQAEALLAKGDAAGAKAQFEAAIAQNQGDTRAWLGLGLSEESLGHTASAEMAYRKAIELDDAFAEAHNNLGLMLRDQGQADAAIAELEKAVRADPRLAFGQANLAMAYEDAGRASEAEQAYRRAVAQTPDDPMLHANFGLFLVTQQRTDDALVQLRAGLAKAGGDRATLVAVGNGLRRAGKPDEAVRALRAAIAGGDGKPTPALLSELALAQHGANDLAGAKASVAQALKLNPKYATAHYVLASLLASEGDVRGATDHYKRCIELDPHGPLVEKAKEKLQAVKQAPTH